MSINVNQKNEFGSNNTNLNQSGNTNSIQISNKLVWKARSQGVIAGILLSIVANFVYDLIK